MGQKVNPISLRLGINRNWEPRWFPTEVNLVENIDEDYKMRALLERKLYYVGVPQILVERMTKKLRVTVVAARPGITIGKKESDVDILKKELQDLIKKDVNINTKEGREAGSLIQLAAESVAIQLEKRIVFRRAMKKVTQGTQKVRAKGIKVSVSGRLGGAEMARIEWYLEGCVPLHTLRAKIDYGFAEAGTTCGNIGAKVWVFKGEVSQKGFQAEKNENNAPAKKLRRTRRGK